MVDHAQAPAPQGRARNSFDELRFGLAMIVLLAHASELTTNAPLAPIAYLFDSHFAVSGFFAISGYLVTKSYLSSANLVDYLTKRARRIYPAYVCVIVFGLCLGALTTQLPITDFALHPETWRYLAANLIFLNFLQHDLPGVFTGNHIAAINGSLWTIKVEVMLYLTVPFLVIFYRYLGVLVTAIAGFAVGVGWTYYFSQIFPHPIGATIAHQFPGQMAYFAIGSALGFVTFTPRAVWGIVALFAIYALFLRQGLAAPYLMAADMVAYPIIVIALGSSALLSLGLGRIGDLSYGIYLFHFPIVQGAEHFGITAHYPVAAFVGIVLATLGTAYLSWHLVEARFLRRSRN